MVKKKRILIIDDDPDMANIICDVGQSMHFNCTVTTNANDFMNAYNSEITLIFLDLVMPGMDGVELLRFLGKKQCKCGIIIVSGTDKRVLEAAEDFANSIGLLIVRRIQKPFRVDELEDILKKNENINLLVTEKKPTIQKPIFTITENELKRAIQNDEFILHYQPKINIATGKIIGVETLVRWVHTEHGIISPDHFINLAESCGLIDELGWLIIKKSLVEFEQVKSKTNSTLTMSLNLSPYSLRDISYPDKFTAILKKHTIDAEDIILEVTESGLLGELSNALDIFTRLRIKQTKLSIDDFGTGYAMMQHLKHIPASELKIDKSFIIEMLTQDSSRVMVQKSIEIGHSLGMKVCAEGVETREQLEFLRANNCDIAQGYFFSKPVPMQELINLILSHDE